MKKTHLIPELMAAGRGSTETGLPLLALSGRTPKPVSLFTKPVPTRPQNYMSH